MDAASLRRDRRAYAAFGELFALPPPARAARLAEIGQQDDDLAQALRRLLSAADDEANAAAAECDPNRDSLGESFASAPPDRSGALISGRLRLLRRLGVGGMGEVYLAERTDIQQQVALKLVRGDVSNPPGRARHERQILARLGHTHIAGLIDAGISDSGEPWFAMEYVEGEPITDWCDRRRLDLRARVRLFGQICAAVQFAHKNLILHRDLKPSNILVNAQGTPKLLDFGIAKLFDAEDGRETQTFALTPAYAAPEQLRGEPATTASDVYQLGLVLYELAGGVSAQDARKALPRHADPALLPRLDQALSTLAARDRPRALAVAQARSTGFDRLRRQLKGDLSRILAKAVADDPHLRYASAQALADDLHRWAGGLPVEARQGSYTYRFEKALRRHPFAATAILALSLGMVAASLIAFDSAHRERVQRDRAEQQRRAAEDQRKLAEEQRRHAEEQRRHAESLLGFMRDVFRLGDSSASHGVTVESAAEMLRRASAGLERRTDVDDTTRAVLLTQIADVYQDLDRMELALGPAERAHALLSPQKDRYPSEYLLGVQVLAEVYSHLGRSQDVVTLVDAALPLAGKALDDSNPWRATLLAARGHAKFVLGNESDGMADENAALAELAEAGDRNSAAVANTLVTAAVVFDAGGEMRRAVELNERIVALAKSDPTAVEQTTLLATQVNLGLLHYRLGEMQAALDSAEPVIERAQALLGPGHAIARFARVIVARARLAMGDYARAREQIEQARALAPASGGDPNVRIITDTARLRLALYSGQFQSAQTQARELVDFARSSGRTEQQRANQTRLLGEVLLQRRDAEGAIETLQRARRSFIEIGGQKQVEMGEIEDSLGRAYSLRRDWSQARVHLQDAVAFFREIQGEDNPNTLRSEIHRVWVDALATRDVAGLDRLAEKRAALIAALGDEARPQVWQLDLLVDDLARTLGRPGIEPARRAHAEAELARMTGRRVPPRFVGLNAF
ncbi:protein kinase domain-containing protein [Dokdonella ginsengisoli]|uniref:Protein kinase n=1 Tax=Dokdonella ginsengisoli TaxID=363846 RepID=A0ABV9QYM8_9GAMM